MESGGVSPPPGGIVDFGTMLIICCRAIITINQTYEIDETIDAWNYRGHELLGELLYQVKNYACSGGVWTQTTDVEGEVNGMVTYDRRLLRPDLPQWNADIQALYDAAAARSNSTMRLL